MRRSYPGQRSAYITSHKSGPRQSAHGPCHLRGGIEDAGVVAGRLRVSTSTAVAVAAEIGRLRNTGTTAIVVAAETGTGESSIAVVVAAATAAIIGRMPSRPCQQACLRRRRCLRLAVFSERV
jgi:hypothetical protein